MKIDIGNTEKLQVSLKDAQKRARVRLLTVSDIQKAAVEVERKLHESKIPKTYWQGITVSVDPYRVSHSYDYPNPESTQAVLERGKEKWFLVDVFRGGCRSVSNGSASEDPKIHIPLTRQLAETWAHNAGFSPFWKEG